MAVRKKDVEKQGPTLKKPEPFDLKKGKKVAERMIRENREWLKEMAKR
jgi:hypothetical protein